jgi:hypothetical protein
MILAMNWRVEHEMYLTSLHNPQSRLVVFCVYSIPSRILPPVLSTCYVLAYASEASLVRLLPQLLVHSAPLLTLLLPVLTKKL